jgi:ApaG protein
MEPAITISSEVLYIDKESNAEQSRFVFAYTIVIENSGSQAAKLLNRHWHITDAQGDVQEVQGPGVIGQQPRLEAGESFRYTSAAVLTTPVGSMHGHYEFVDDDDSRFLVQIPAFSLFVPNLVH